MAETYKVGEIVERRSVAEDGKPIKTYRVRATTISGVDFMIEVDEKDFTKAKIDKVLTARAANIEEIKAL